jgi:predicted transcriptional regulator
LTIKDEIRSKVIQMSQYEGRSRNEIAKTLGISQGSTSSIISSWKQGKNKGDSANTDQPKSVDDITIASSNDQGRHNVNSGHNVSTKTSVPLNNTDSPENSSLNDEQDIDFADIPYQESYPGPDPDTHDLESKKDILQKQIEENRRILETDKKTADDFLAVKEEIAKCGIKSESVQFINVIRTFRKYNYNPSEIMNGFLDIQDVVIAKERIKSLKKETDYRIQVLQRKLERLGLGSFEKLRRVIVAIMTLETFGIGVDQIINYHKILANL